MRLYIVFVAIISVIVYGQKNCFDGPRYNFVSVLSVYLNVVSFLRNPFSPSLDDCLHTFWYCTDNVGKWPDNEQFCRKLFAACEKKLPAYVQKKFNNFAATEASQISRMELLLKTMWEWNQHKNKVHL